MLVEAGLLIRRPVLGIDLSEQRFVEVHSLGLVVPHLLLVFSVVADCWEVVQIPLDDRLAALELMLGEVHVHVPALIHESAGYQGEISHPRHHEEFFVLV